MEWIVSNWELISTMAVFVIGLINLTTTHWSGHAGLVKWGLFITEVLSFFASKNVPGLLKLPLTSKAPGAKKPPVLPILLALMFMGCGSWQSSVKTSLDITGTTASTVREVVGEYYKERCGGVARGCAQAKDIACPALVDCQEKRHQVYTVLAAIQIARVGGYGAVTMGNEEDARSKAAKAMQMISDLFKSLTLGGIL